MNTHESWTLERLAQIYHLPFNDLIFQAQQAHQLHFKNNDIQVATLLSVKTGRCSEDCKYCSQSGHYKTSIDKQSLLSEATVIEKAKLAKANGADRFCLGGAWRSPPEKDFPQLLSMIKEVKALGLETCLTAGMLSSEQAQALKAAGLDYYNHNLDTSREYYPEIISTHTYDDRLDTLKKVQQAGMKVCCGGILNLGESIEDRLKLLLELANLQPYPESVPINKLVPIPGTPLANNNSIDPFDFVRTIALARIIMPKSRIRLSAGRNDMSD
ncbi:MAG TPA: biotin synthase BioB, partial [Gammaproteobacteria bacterium]|nr:biotin synthase BioB [Gammaproteobacteria bacterium]